MKMFSTCSVKTGTRIMWGLLIVVNLLGLSRAENSDPIRLAPSQTSIEKQQGAAMFVTCYSDRVQHTTWLNTKNKQVNFSKGRIHVENSLAHGISLVFEDIRGEDRGNYTCKTLVDGKEYRKTFELTVVVPTSFNKTLEVQESQLGHNMTLRCHARGEPEPSIMWRFNGRPVDGEKYRFLHQGLFIYNVSLNDSGVYVCRALQLTPSVSTLKEFKITAVILHKPIFEEKHEVVHGYLKGSVNLTCRVKGEPKPKFQWTKDKKTITETEHISVEGGDHISTLQVVLDDKSSFGNYTCKASNKLGSAEKVLTLKVGDQPNPPEEFQALHVTSDTIKMKIVPPDGGVLPIIGYRVHYVPKRGGDISWDEGKFMDFPIDEGETYTLQGLSQDTEYAVRVQSRNAAGFSSHSEEECVRTEKIQADSITESSAAGSTVSVLWIISLYYLL